MKAGANKLLEKQPATAEKDVLWSCVLWSCLWVLYSPSSPSRITDGEWKRQDCEESIRDKNSYFDYTLVQLTTLEPKAYLNV